MTDEIPQMQEDIVSIDNELRRLKQEIYIIKQTVAELKRMIGDPADYDHNHKPIALRVHMLEFASGHYDADLFVRRSSDTCVRPNKRKRRKGCLSRS